MSNTMREISNPSQPPLFASTTCSVYWHRMSHSGEGLPPPTPPFEPAGIAAVPTCGYSRDANKGDDVPRKLSLDRPNKHPIQLFSTFFHKYFQLRMADNKPGASRNETSAAGRSATDPLEAEPVPGEPVVTAPNQPEASNDPTGILSPDHWAQVRRKVSNISLFLF